MKRLLHNLKLALFILGLAMPAFNARSESVLVVANTDEPELSLTRLEVRNLFMGGASKASLNAIALPPRSLTRIMFNTAVIGLTEARIQAYWAQMRFTGRKRPPREFQNEQAALEYIQANKGAVGYFPADTVVPEGLTVLYRSD